MLIVKVKELRSNKIKEIHYVACCDEINAVFSSSNDMGFTLSEKELAKNDCQITGKFCPFCGEKVRYANKYVYNRIEQ